MSIEYADIIDSGLWFSPLREALDAFVDRIQQRVTGTVRLKLFKGDCHVVLSTASAGTRGWQTSTVVPQE